MPSSTFRAKLSASAQEAYARAKQERPSQGLWSDKAAEPTLEEARADLARAIAKISHKLFADRFGPLVGTVTETTVNATLANFEIQLTRAKGDITQVVQEIADRIIK